MDLNLKYCLLTVDDADKALSFYRDALGMEVRADVGSDNMRWVTVGFPGVMDGEIVLATIDGNPNLSAEDKRAITELMAKGVMGFVVLGTDDVNGMFERVRAAGGEVMQEPVDQPYGVRDCAFRDPAGNIVRINTRG
ncbi:MAG TPA: VOC family protein [Streptosporangiaceae bacterium]|jgi:catechol 2,3-dioxygenase-like lactoylglutathione lyase family enzyme